MPTPAELVAAVADATGFSERTIATYYRGLREAQHIGEGGRGRNALRLRLTDATKVLTAALTSGEAKEAPETIEMLYGLKARPPSEFPKGTSVVQYPCALKPAFFARLCHRVAPRPTTFGSTLDSMMTAIAFDRLAPLPDDDDIVASMSDEEVRREKRMVRGGRYGEAHARVELRSVLRDERFQLEGASLSFGRRGVFGVILTFADNLGTASTARARGRGGAVADYRVGLLELSKLATHFVNDM